MLVVWTRASWGMISNYGFAFVSSEDKGVGPWPAIRMQWWTDREWLFNDLESIIWLIATRKLIFTFSCRENFEPIPVEEGFILNGYTLNKALPTQLTLVLPLEATNQICPETAGIVFVNREAGAVGAGVECIDCIRITACQGPPSIPTPSTIYAPR